MHQGPLRETANARDREARRTFRGTSSGSDPGDNSMTRSGMKWNYGLDCFVADPPRSDGGWGCAYRVHQGPLRETADGASKVHQGPLRETADGAGKVHQGPLCAFAEHYGAQSGRPLMEQAGSIPALGANRSTRRCPQCSMRVDAFGALVFCTPCSPSTAVQPCCSRACGAR